MSKDYKMITVEKFINMLSGTKCLNISEYQISLEIEKHLLSEKRKETNAKIIEKLLAI